MGQLLKIIQLSPAVINNCVESIDQCFWSDIMDAEHHSHSSSRHAVHVVTLVTKEGKHHHRHAMTNALIDSMRPTMSDKGFCFGVTFKKRQELKSHCFLQD